MQHKINKYIKSVEDEEYKWGTYDCFKFCSRAVEFLTGTDLMADIQYDSLSTARRHLARGWTDSNGVKIKAPKTSEGFWTELLGTPRDALYAQPGDIVLLPTKYKTPVKFKRGDKEITLLDTDKQVVAGVGVMSDDGYNAWVLNVDDIVSVPIKHFVLSWSIDHLYDYEQQIRETVDD